jgi:hypothetical protein
MKRVSHSVPRFAERKLVAAPGFAQAECLVGLGFRHWLHGYRTGDISCWEKVWCTYSGAMGAQAAKSTVCRLSGWVRAITEHTHRPLETSPGDFPGFCRDECVAIAMIAACQHQACPAMRACAFALLGCSLIDDVVEGAESFAASMRGADQVLSRDHARQLPLLAALPPATKLRH